MHSSRMRTVRSSSRLLGGVCSRGEGRLPGGVCSGGGGGGGGVGIPACTETDPSCGQTDRCKNITFATSLRTVNIDYRQHPGYNQLGVSHESPIIFIHFEVACYGSFYRQLASSCTETEFFRLILALSLDDVKFMHICNVNHTAFQKMKIDQS